MVWMVAVFLVLHLFGEKVRAWIVLGLAGILVIGCLLR